MRRERGFTLIELMVGLVVASIAVGFIFRIYATSSVAYRTQSQLAETMQSLRTAKQLLTKELRNAGYYASGMIDTQVNTGQSSSTAGIYTYSPLRIVNSSTGPDELYVSYADTNCEAHVTACTHGNCPFNSAESDVDNTSCFQDGDVVMAVRTADPKKGQGCILEITHVQDTPGKLQHHPDAPYNDSQNHQCDNIATYTDPSSGAISNIFYDGNTYFVKYKVHGYRIKSNDARGVLQYSATGGVQNDWQDIAMGFVDMQFALQVYQPNDTATDEDGDGNTKYEWLSGANMGTIDLSTGSTSIVQMRVNLLARTIAEVEGPGTTSTPSMLGSSTRPSNNNIGDHGAVTISSITSTSSPYYGNYIYRMVSTMVDLRNLGTGTVQ